MEMEEEKWKDCEFNGSISLDSKAGEDLINAMMKITGVKLQYKKETFYPSDTWAPPSTHTYYRVVPPTAIDYVKFNKKKIK